MTRSDGAPDFSVALTFCRTYQRAPIAALEIQEPTVSVLASKAERAEAAKARAAAVRRRDEAQLGHKAAIKDKATALLRDARAVAPPLSPSSFAEVLRSKKFADGGDAVGELRGEVRGKVR